MAEAAWGASLTRSRIGARLRRLVRRFGKQHAKKAAIATAHTLLLDHGGGHGDQPQRDRL